MKTKYDAIVVGSGPNGFAAAITLQRSGLSVLLIEGKEKSGGGVRSAELTLPGFIHDVCSAVYPLGEDSPVFKPLQLEQFGLKWLTPENAIAHPFDDGSAIAIRASIEETANQLGKDANNYKNVFSPLVKNWDSLRSSFLGPLHLSAYSNAKAKFAYYAMSSAAHFAKNHFDTEAARQFLRAWALIPMLPLDMLTTTSMAIVSQLDGSCKWHGRCQKVAHNKLLMRLQQHFRNSGGEIQTGNMITSLKQLPSSRVVLLDVTPAQLLSIAGDEFRLFINGS